eukprot:366528-Chlamydomonas_euryale.AAC.6
MGGGTVWHGWERPNGEGEAARWHLSAGWYPSLRRQCWLVPLPPKAQCHALVHVLRGAQIFAERPHVQRAFASKVPSDMSEKEFWTKFVKHELRKEVGARHVCVWGGGRGRSSKQVSAHAWPRRRASLVTTWARAQTLLSF